LLLKSVEIFGFKSFPKKTRIGLDSGITALVGPNGCGKSNIVDAIRWALGEQRPNTLRCERMNDIIFNGSQTRKSLGLAEVTLTFANDGSLDLGFEEVEVTRRLYRSGESEYLLNRALCRHKDIVDLFLNTGLSSKAYSMITFDMVDKILKEDPEVRRNFFEEAAGIAKYRTTRGHAVRKLEATEDDLLRLNDIILEVERTCRSLKRQAARAKRYQILKKELKELEAAYLLAKFTELRKARENLKEERARLEEARNSKMADLAVREEEFRKKKEELKEKEVEYSRVLGTLEKTREEITTIERELARFRERKKSLEERLDRLLTDRSEIEKRIPTVVDQVKSARTELVRLEKTISEVESGMNEKAETLERAEEELSALAKQRDDLTEKLKRIQNEENDKRKIFFALEAQEQVQIDRIQKLQTDAKETEHELRLASWSLSEGIDHVDSFSEVLKGWEAELNRIRKLVEDSRKARNALLDREADLRQRTLTARSELDLLKVLEERKEGLEPSAKVLLESGGIAKTISTIADSIEVPEEYVVAIEGALGAALSTILCEGEEDALSAIELLKKERKGRASFAPLSILRRSQLPGIQQDEAILGPASQFVRCSDSYRPAVDALLDMFLVCEDLPAAIRLYRSGGCPNHYLLTKTGEVIEPTGIIRGGSHSEQPLLGRRRRIETLEKNVSGLEKFRSNVEHELLKKEVKIQKLQAEFSRMDESYQEEMKKRLDAESFASAMKYAVKNLEERLAKIEQERRNCGTEIERVLGRKSQIEEEIKETSSEKESIQSSLSSTETDLRARRDGMRKISSAVEQEKMELYRLRVQYDRLKSDLGREEESIDSLRKELTAREEERERITLELSETSTLLADKESLSQEVNSNKTTLQTEMAELESRRREQQRKIEEGESDVERISLELKEHQEKIQDLRIRLMEVETKGESLKDRASEELGLDLDELGELEKEEVREEDLERVRAKISALEPINMLAFQEYEEGSKRLENLLSQREDLTEAKEALKKTLKKIDKSARERFLETFENVRGKFKDVFAEVFDGGEADVLLVGDPDPLRAEIQVVASPKGKKLTRLDALSSGEKALVAISLLFAIFLVKPSPLCVLDEIDAPLDDANINTYIRLLRKVGHRSQIALITHNKTTMESANFLYGITMEEPGVSKVVSVRLKEEEARPVPELASRN
jgi:chromosome segregation protein